MTKKNRLQLLTEPEIEDFYARPNFNSGERELYFAMNPQEMIALHVAPACYVLASYES